MTTTDLLPTLDSLISSRSLLKHSFYVKWSKGELTIDDLKTYAKEYYHLVEHIPLIVSRMMTSAPEELLGHLLEHSEDETRHIALWLRFAEALGLPEEEVETYEPSERTKAAVETLVALTEQGFIGGVAAMYALERELPKIAETKLQGLIQFYGFDQSSPRLRPAGRLTTGGMKSADARAYFEEHLLEEEHFSFWQTLLQSLTEAEAKAATEAAQASLEAQNQLLDAVCELRGIAKHC